MVSCRCNWPANRRPVQGHRYNPKGGQTGSGKSEGIKAIITGLAHFYTKDQLKFLLVDGKQGVELDKFGNLPHCEGRVGENARDAIQSMQNACEEMNDRYQGFRRENVTDIFTYNQKVSDANRLPWWIVILDEYAQLGAVKEHKESIEHHLQQLGQMARAAGIHVIISTQKPTAEVINNVLKENLVGRLAFRVTAGTSSQVILDQSGAEILNGKGDAFFRDLKGTQRFQCCLVSKSTLDRALS